MGASGEAEVAQDPDNTSTVVGPFRSQLHGLREPLLSFAGGVGENRDHHENYKIHTAGSCEPLPGAWRRGC